MRHGSGVRLTAALCLSLVLFGSTVSLPGRDFVGRFDLRPASGDQGGFSAIWISAKGDRTILLSDRGFALSGNILRDGSGKILDLALAAPLALQFRDAAPARAASLDTEGLAINPAGTIFITTEGHTRVLRLDGLGGGIHQIGRPRDFRAMPRNGGLESLAIANDGALFTVPETPLQPFGPFQLYRQRNGNWSVFAMVPRTGYFVPVSADIGPDGRLYLLFRGFGGLSGFAALLQRFDIADGGIGPAENLLQTPFGLHGNLEGLSIWRNENGVLIATLIADDNFNPIQSSEIVEYRLPD